MKPDLDGECPTYPYAVLPLKSAFPEEDLKTTRSGRLSDASQLWHKYQNKLAEDFFRHAQLNDDNQISERLRESYLNRCLLAIQDIVISIGGNPISQYGMPEPSFDGEHINRDYAMEINYDPVDLADILQTDVSRLTEEQRSIFDRVCRSVDSALGEMLFVDAPGGTGKTFLTKVILAKVRSQSKIALAVASSGIAATLLSGGKTAHTMFKIPIDLDRTENPVCNISRNSDKAKVLRDCSLIIWDECTMANRKAVEAVDRTLRDIKQNNQPMGGITVLFCGDFRQTLPVIPRGTRADEVRACLKSSHLWHYIIPLHLTLNMRAQIGGNQNAQEFSELLLEIGNGVYPQEQGKVVLNENLCSKVSSIRDLISKVYGNPTQILTCENYWLCERAILTPRNDQAATINAEILSLVSGDNVEYISINRVMEEGESTSYPVEFLESLSAPGLPAHKIKLKIGVPIMLLRNLSPPKLCNGTRLK
ncbi:ATP-dependent DNA helicase PIF1-like, partial [Trichoplusia ni]